MKILLATPIYPPELGGPATYTVELAQRLAGAHEVTILAYADSDAVPVAGAKLITVSKTLPLPVRLLKYFFVLVLQGGKYDVIYVQNAVAAGLPAALAGVILGVPVVLKFVGDEAWERATNAGQTTKQLEDFYKAPQGGFRTRVFMAIQKFALRNVSLVTTPSAYLARLLGTYYGVKEDRIIVNYNAVSEPEARTVQARVPYQLSVACRLVPWKHVDGILRAVHMLEKKFPDMRLVIAGDGPEKLHLEQLMRELNVADRVTFLGRVSQEKARDLQASSTVHILNSSYEGLPHEVLNSFAVGTPVVATDIPGTNEVVINNETGLLVPQGNDEALAAAIERMFTDASLRERLALGGAQLLKEKFSWGAHLRKLTEMFERAK